MKQSFLSFILALLPILASADKSGTCGDNLTWSYVEETKTLTISGNGEMTHYTRTGTPWYSFRSSISDVIIESGVTSIGQNAFAECYGLKTATIGDHVATISSKAFYNCSSLPSIIIPNNVTSIDSQVFFGCTSLTSITIGDNVLSIGDQAFYNCNSLTSITIPNKVSSIGNNAFYGCI